MSKQSLLPPYGLITEIAKITGYNRLTVTKALRQNAKGIKAEKVRQLYRAKYMDQTK